MCGRIKKIDQEVVLLMPSQSHRKHIPKPSLSYHPYNALVSLLLGLHTLHNPLEVLHIVVLEEMDCRTAEAEALLDGVAAALVRNQNVLIDPMEGQYVFRAIFI